MKGESDKGPMGESDTGPMGESHKGLMGESDKGPLVLMNKETDRTVLWIHLLIAVLCYDALEIFLIN